ncbi:10A19I.15 [Zea mays]|uniref:10A19I.15 n=2 Tax=Zea mays TaxID=4577 RepID=A0A1D6N1D1_MAIZE|nr:10A19I.15 [Zea mays]ONM34529.1 10A19I.15 [Zea mays]
MEMDDVQEIEQRSQPQIFWTQEMSACALKYLAQLVADGIRVDKGFKSSHYNQCAKVVKERFQVQVSGSQVTNHLKTWRTRWSNICNYKKISSAHFDEQTGTILLDEKNYLERVQATAAKENYLAFRVIEVLKKPSEAKFFNKPLENYHYMAVIFGNHQATGLFAKCTSDPLGFDTSESAGTYGVGYSGDLAGHESNNASPTRDSGESLNPSGPIRDGGDSSTRSGARRKRGRMMMEDEDPLICTVTEAFKTLSDAIKQSAPQPRPIIPPNLWTMMKQIPVFEREHIAHYYGYLCENPALAYAFLEMGLDDQMVWVSRYIKTHLSD